MSLINAIKSGFYRVALLPKQNERILTNKGIELRDAILSGKKDYDEYGKMNNGKLENLIDFGRIYEKKGYFTMNVLEKDVENVESKDGKDDLYFIYLGKKV